LFTTTQTLDASSVGYLFLSNGFIGDCLVEVFDYLPADCGESFWLSFQAIADISAIAIKSSMANISSIFLVSLRVFGRWR
jgi:hypothetical protein